LKPIALRCVAQLSSTTHLPISATGGIYTWEDAAEFILLGASNLQICSAVMEQGYGIIGALKDGLLRYMEAKGFESIDDFCGLSLPHIVKHNELDRGVRGMARVQTDRCIGCGRCVSSCRDNGYRAITVEDKTAVVNPSRCDGCGLCTQICPVGCIDFVFKA
jgi:dihydropyrimidine dehydrogenase (NAD+) subunit PreA